MIPRATWGSLVLNQSWVCQLPGLSTSSRTGNAPHKLRIPRANQSKPRNEWDLIGGVACILAAGGRCTDGAGEPYAFNRPDPLHIGVCGTNGAIHEAVLGMMRR